MKVDHRRCHQAGSTLPTGERNTGFRLFDVGEVPDYAARLGMTPAALSEWREAGGQPFVPEDRLHEHAERLGLEVKPRVASVDALPGELQATLDFLAKTLPTTLSRLDGGAGGEPEGLVARTRDRATIAKLRFSDYRRTLKRRAKKR